MDELIDFVSHTLANNIIFSVGVLLFAGHFFAELAMKIKLPDITGYIIAGLVLGHSTSGVINEQASQSLQVVTQIALALIALSIGFQFSIEKIKQSGMKILIITMMEVLSAFSLVSLALYFCGMDLPFALLLGAISSATAPAATVAIVHHMKAEGEFVDYLFGVVGLDDAVCIILYGIVSAFAFSLLGSQTGNVDSIKLIQSAFTEVALSVVIGVLCALALYIFTYKQEEQDKLLVITLAIIFITISLSMSLHLSSLLTSMAAGFVFINISPKGKQISEYLLHFEAPIIILFFAIAGTELQPAVFLKDKKVLLLGMVYILFRAIGKYGGNFLGCVVSGVKPKIRNYLGFCMLPQAGVALGLVLTVKSTPSISLLLTQSPQAAAIITNMINIVLLSVFVNELFGPIVAEWALKKGTEKKYY
ncbi:cation:proton antiporter [Candidatus Riflebacteria bacterium]